MLWLPSDSAVLTNTLSVHVVLNVVVGLRLFTAILAWVRLRDVAVPQESDLLPEVQRGTGGT